MVTSFWLLSSQWAVESSLYSCALEHSLVCVWGEFMQAQSVALLSVLHMANACKEKALVVFGSVSVPTVLVGNTEHGQLFALTLKTVKTFFLSLVG